MQKIMVIEDEPSIRDELVFLLENEGYTALPITDFNTIGELFDAERPDLVLLDINLPRRDGFSLCADIRKVSKAPIIFVTSRDTAMDELRALALGGDDYVTKPYNIPLLLARIKAVMRRSGSLANPDTLEVNGLALDLTKGVIASNGKTLELTRNEIKILAHLMGNPGAIISRADLIDAMWDSELYIDDNTLSVNVTRLRTKLEALGHTEYIKTRRGMGYQI